MFWNQLTGHLSLSHSYAYRYLLVTFIMLFVGSRPLFAQPANDSCAVARQITVPTAYNTPETYSGHNIGATPEIPASFIANCTPGGLFSTLGADVWFTFSPTDNMCVSFSVEGLQEPEITIREGDLCFSTTEIDCASSSNGAVTTTVNLEANLIYYLRVSGAEYADQGNFELSLNRIFCQTDDPCLGFDDLTVSPEPFVLDFQGQEILYYPPETQVSFCYTVFEWYTIADNWLHSIQIEFGDAWDLATLEAFPPQSCNFNGEWAWYDYWYSCNTNTEFGPGFAYDSFNGLGCNGTAFDGLPGNNWGDGPGFCGPVEFCWVVSVKSCEQIDDDMVTTDLDIEITTLADSQSGSYIAFACDQISDEALELQTGCSSGGGGGSCLPQIATIETTNVSCYDARDGSFTIFGDDAGLNSNVLVYDLNDVLIEAYLDVSLPFTLPSILDTGFYGIILETPGIDEEGFCPGYLLGLINIRGPFETITRIDDGNNTCLQDSVQLNGIIWPPTTEEVTYLWSGPNDFFSNEASPTVTELGEYILTIIKDGCRISDTLHLEFRTPLSLEIDSPNGIPCLGDELVLTTTGAGITPDNYEWIIPPGNTIQDPEFNFIDLAWQFGPITTDVNLFLVGFDEDGCSDTIPYSIQIAETPIVDFEIDVEDCATENVVASILDNPLIDEIIWLDDNSNANTRIFTGLAPGEVFNTSVEISYNNFACTLIEEVSIIGPGLNLEVSDTFICTGNVVLSASLAESYLWSTGETSASIEVTPPWDESTEYAVTITDSYGCEHMESTTIHSFFEVSADFTFMGEDLTYQFTPVAPEVDATTYYWEFGDGNVSNDYAPQHSYASSGDYEVVLTVVNACGAELFGQDVNIQFPPVAAFTTDDPTQGCSPLEITFLNQSSNAEGYLWTFPGGVPASSTALNPTVTYLNAGVYPVQLSVTNSAGEDIVIAENLVEVFPDPSGSFTYLSELLTVQFTSTINNTDSYLWDFGDGNTSTEANPSHLYASGGTYDVSLSITNECGTVVITEEVGVMRPIPEVSFTTEDAQQGCAPLTVTFQNQSLNADTYLWVFPGGEPGSSTEENPTITYSIPGVYNVQLNATNESGTNTLVAQFYIEVFPEPSGSFTHLSELLNVQFNTTVENTDSYLWDFGDGNTSTEANPSHQYDSGGTYDVSLSITNECGTVVITEEVGVMRPIPEVSFTTEDAQQGCAPLTVTFQNQSLNADTYLWVFPGGEPGSSTEENPTTTYSIPGVYDVQLNATNESGTNTLVAQFYIEVFPEPSGSFTHLSELLNVQFNTTVENTDSYLWDFGDGNTSTEANPSHQYASGGTYDVSLSITNECGTVIITEEVVVMRPFPQVAFTTEETPQGCAPLSVTFVNESIDADSYQWLFPGGAPSSSTEEHPTVVYNEAGSYPVELTASNESGGVTVLQIDYIEVLPLPFASFTATNDMLMVSFTSSAMNVDSYFWDFGDGNTSTEANPVHTYAEAGEYQVSLTVENECASVSISNSIMVIATDLIEINDQASWLIYPNPSSGTLWLEVIDWPTHTNSQISIFNALGELMVQQKVLLAPGNSRTPLTLDLPSGVYWLKLEREEFSGVMQKIILH